MAEEESIPFKGLTFLNTRDSGSAPVLSDLLMEKGGAVVECPTIELTRPKSWEAFDKRLKSVTKDDWIVFTSPNAVRATLDRIWSLNQPYGALSLARIAVIGQGTGDVLRAEKLEIDLIPPLSQQEVLLRYLLEMMRKDDRVWIPRAQEARDVLETGLQAAGYEVVVTPVYRTVLPEAGIKPAVDNLLAGRIDWMLFTSTSTVINFFELMDDESRSSLENRWPKVACIGAVTAESARECGLGVQVVPSRQDVPGMVDAIADYITRGETE
ncbi:MAG: uroporphyrinogen-III synthase [bacterium]